MMITVNHVHKSYAQKGKGFKKESLHVLNDISFSIEQGECMGLVGESGSGKSTLGRLLLGLEQPDDGSILIEGQTVKQWTKANKGMMSVVFQDYTSSANPSFTVKDIISEPMIVLKQKKDLNGMVNDLLEKVNLPLSMADRYPHELSGGQLQRVCIARAISTNPRFIVLDEAISSLDVSVQAQILELLHTLKDELQMTCLFIAHDLQAVAHLCDQVMFLYEGKLVEKIAVDRLSKVQHTYAQRLLESVIPFHVHSPEND